MKAGQGTQQILNEGRKRNRQRSRGRDSVRVANSRWREWVVISVKSSGIRKHKDEEMPITFGKNESTSVCKENSGVVEKGKLDFCQLKSEWEVGSLMAAGCIKAESYLFVMGPLSMPINWGNSTEREVEETRRDEIRSRDGGAAQIGLKRRTRPHPSKWREKKRWMYLSTGSKARERKCLTCLRQDQLLRVKEGKFSTAGLWLVTKGSRRGSLLETGSMFGDSEFVEGRSTCCKLSQIPNLFC